MPHCLPLNTCRPRAEVVIAYGCIVMRLTTDVKPEAQRPEAPAGPNGSGMAQSTVTRLETDEFPDSSAKLCRALHAACRKVSPDRQQPAIDRRISMRVALRLKALAERVGVVDRPRSITAQVRHG